MKIKKQKGLAPDWLEVIIYGLWAVVLIGLSVCLILLTEGPDKLFAAI